MTSRRTPKVPDTPVSSPLRVAFLHPDLGLGGAERLVVDAALACQSRGAEVRMFTAHHEPGRCFEETRDGTIPVKVYGDWLPRSLCGRFFALFAYIRMIVLALCVVFLEKDPVDVYFCDVVSACIPVLRLRRGVKIVFYCHYPDRMLTTRTNVAKRLYRLPIDTLEERTTGMADRVLVNSRFTRSVFTRAFPSLGTPHVLYPSINFSAFDRTPSADPDVSWAPSTATTVFLSINRYERKKNLMLAVEAFSLLRQQLDDEKAAQVHLIVAGGYDTRERQNVEYHEELVAYCERTGIRDQVTFLRSFSDAHKLQLLARCSCLLYTPENEHFGIGPLEAMYTRRPAIAANSGGPLETVVDGQTGFLCDPTADAWAAKMLLFCGKEGAARSSRMGLAGRKRVVEMFSFNAFASELLSHLQMK